jgi:hypothetical protein
MARAPQETLELQLPSEEAADERELYLRDGRKIVIGDHDRLVEIRSESGLVELRIRLTEQGPVLQLEGVRLALSASEAVEIAAPRVAITATEQLELAGGDVVVRGEQDVEIEAKANDVTIQSGHHIHIQP